MSKVFGWNVRQGSLYEKELHTLRNVMNDNVEDRQAIEETTEIINKIHQDGEKANLTPDEVYYANEETGRLGIRVTSAIQADEENTEEKINEDGTKQRIPKRFDKNSPWTTPSTNIGTGIDEFTRDFFLGKLDNLTEDKLEAQYPNVTGNDWVAFREQLKQFRDNLRSGKTIKGKNITIVSRDIKAIGQVDVTMPDGTVKKLDVTGTLDLLGYDQDGKFYIFDMKTVHSDNYLSDTEKSKKWNRQLQLYKQCLVDKYSIDVAGTYIIPIKVNYDIPKGAKYKDGTDMGGTAEYTVRNLELKTKYDNPMRSQILQNGEEFREAAPELRPILEKKPKPGNIKYEYLDDAAKAVLDGTVTIDNYRQQETTTETKEEPITVEPVEVQKPAAFGKDNSRKMRGRFRSSVTELNTTKNYTPEMQSIKEAAIANGTFMKAPNGNPTNLNERQWLQVRTKAFKNWFGDWEKEYTPQTNIYKENPWERYMETEDTGRTYVGHSGKTIPIIINKGVKYVHPVERITPTDKDPFGFNSYNVNNLIIVGKEVDADRNFDGICQITARACKDFLKNRYNIESSVEIIKAKSPVKDAIIDHWVTVLSINGEAYIYDMPQTEYIKQTKPLIYDGKELNGYYEGVIVSKYTPRLIKVTEENLSKFYKDNNENDKQIQVIKDTVKRLNKDKKSIDLNDLQYKPAYDRNVSKVVDENGEPLVVYHRSPNKFNTFDVNKIGTTTDTGQYGKGFYFGIESDRADGNNVYEVFLNIRNPYNITKESRSSNIAYTYNRPFNEWTDWHKKNISKEEAYLVNSKDGIIDLVEDYEFVVSNPNQIKSATDNSGAFSTTNNDIRYSSVTEQPIKVPSVTSFAERLPAQQQPRFAYLVARGEISTSCR